MRRVARVGSPVRFPPPFIPGCSPTRASHSIVLSVIMQCRRSFPDAADVVWCHWELGFSQCRFNHARRACESHDVTSLHASSLSRHARFPIGFPRQVGRLPWKLLPSSTFCSSGAIPCAPKRRTTMYQITSNRCGDRRFSHEERRA